MLPAALYTGAMPLEPAHLRRHLLELRDRVRFLRALEPDAPAYRLWLGDVIQLVNEQYGLNSPQMQQLRAAIARGGRQPADTPEERQALYLQRLNDLELLLNSYLRAIGEPIAFFE
jgi:hypothetical protein